MTERHIHRHADHVHHEHGGSSAQTKVAIAAVITFLFMFAEVIGGVISGSLALLADAAHMLTDAGSLALAWVGYHLAKRPADPNRTFGFSRFRVLAAFANGILLIGLAAWILIEAATRLLDPQPVLSGIMFWVAMGGLAVNIAMFAMMHSGGDHEHDLNMRGALVHVMGDLLGSVAAIIAAIVIWQTGWTTIDPILSAGVAVILLFTAWPVIRRSAHILLQGVPHGIDAAEIARDLTEHYERIRAVHHVHAWTMTGEDRFITLHLITDDPKKALDIVPDVRERLADRFGIQHATIELECPDDPADTCHVGGLTGETV